jgi:ribonucleoside-diphosphate reductase alpha chain
MTRLLPNFSENALTILEKRYLATIKGKRETVEEFIDRISMGNEEYRRELIEPLHFLPNSPTLFNLGVPGGGTLSACFKFDVADTMLDGENGIMDTATKAAMVTKWGGGVGYYVGGLRGAGALVNSTHGKAMGPVAVLRFYNAMGSMLTQSGKRDAAQMGIMDVGHPDIREFIHMKDNDPQSLSTFNISVALTDEFMEKAVNDPRGAEGLLLAEIAGSAWRTGDPGVYFVDAAERDNPTPLAGRLTGTNPCGEVPLLNNEPCNLGSINLRNMVVDGSFNYEKLRQVTRLATRYLDDILGRNHFPDYRITAAALYTRKLGLGVCGWADALALMGIPYASQEAVDLLDEVMAFIRKEADEESIRLGRDRGSAPCFATGPIPKRNATTLCIAPTGSIAILMGASSGIEPHFLTEWTRTMGDGTVLQESIPVLDEIGDFKPQTAMEIPWEWHVKHQAAAQKHVDLAVSKTINLPNDATVDDVLNAYIMMWESGCKGGTIFRDGSRTEQVLNAHIEEELEAETTTWFNLSTMEVEKCDECGSTALAFQEGCVDCLSCGWSACSV